MIPLIPALLHDPEWSLVYADNVSLVFAKNIPGNRETTDRFSVTPHLLWKEVIAEATLKYNTYFGGATQANFLVTIGDAYFAQGQYDHARGAYVNAVKISPGHLKARQRLFLLNSR
jgi:hypothetical protein